MCLYGIVIYTVLICHFVFWIESTVRGTVRTESLNMKYEVCGKDAKDDSHARKAKKAFFDMTKTG